MNEGKSAIIVGAGLVGSLWAVYLSKAGYKVTIYERRSDIRKADISAGKSINLALSARGWKALDAVGVGDEIRKIAIPMTGRVMHDLEGNLTYQPYGKEGQAIFSISRGGVNAKMMDIAEEHGGATIHYNHECVGADTENGIVHVKNSKTGEVFEVKADVVFAADGAFSAVRYNAFQKLDRFNFSQMYIEDGYREILLPANSDGSYKLELNALHIWPRGRFMLIALPNEDGSFTCTLFMPQSGDKNSFDSLDSKQKVEDFFKETFPDFFEMMPEIADAWEDHPLSSLAIMRSYPWHHGKFALMGDSAHATVPFYGQGMNGGFEDCTVLSELMQKHNEDWNKVFAEYSVVRKPDGDALQDLSLHNYYVMRDYVADPDFLLQKKIEEKFSTMYPDKWLPLYSMVSFSDVRYSDAYRLGMEQDKIMKDVMAETPNINDNWDSQEVMDKILEKSKRMKFILTLAIIGLAFAGFSQRDLNPRNSKKMFGGAQSFQDYNLYGIQFQLGGTYTMNGRRDDRYDVNGVFRGDYLHDPKGRLGAYAEIGMFHFPKKFPKIKLGKKNIILLSYYDWGLGFKYFRGAEQITANFEDASGGYIGSEDRTYGFSNGNVYGRFSLHKNQYFKPKKRKEKLNFFLDHSIGLNFDYRVLQTADAYTDWYGVMEQNQQYYRPFHAQLHYGLGFGFSPRRGMFIIPGVRLPLLGYHTATPAMGGDGGKETYFGKPSMHWFSSRYWPILFQVKFMFALPKKQKGCATGITNDQDQETQRNR